MGNQINNLQCSSFDNGSIGVNNKDAYIGKQVNQFGVEFSVLKYNDISHYFLYLFATFVKMSLAGIILIFCIYMAVIMFQIQVPTTLEYRFITMMSFLLSFGIFLCLSEFAFRKIRNRYRSSLP